MMILSKVVLLLFAIVFASTTTTTAFVMPSTTQRSSSTMNGIYMPTAIMPYGQQQQAKNQLKSNTMTIYKNTRLYGGLSMDGSGRGSVILFFVMTVVVWMFTIPPEFRRANICTDERCTENRLLCGNCVTPDEWITSVKEYYKNGGGIQWDFSIDPKTVQKNKEFLDSLTGK